MNPGSDFCHSSPECGRGSDPILFSGQDEPPEVVISAIELDPSWDGPEIQLQPVVTITHQQVVVADANADVEKILGMHHELVC